VRGGQSHVVAVRTKSPETLNFGPPWSVLDFYRLGCVDDFFLFFFVFDQGGRAGRLSLAVHLLYRYTYTVVPNRKQSYTLCRWAKDFECAPFGPFVVPEVETHAFWIGFGQSLHITKCRLLKHIHINVTIKIKPYLTLCLMYDIIYWIAGEIQTSFECVYFLKVPSSEMKPEKKEHKEQTKCSGGGLKNEDNKWSLPSVVCSDWKTIVFCSISSAG
jgi:hypothetical protein